MKKNKERLQQWKERYEQAREEYKQEMSAMERRQKIYDGDNTIYDVEGRPTKRKATHVRNIGFEMVETQVDSNIPAPKVTAVRKGDEHLAKIIEDMIRNVCDRLPMVRLNDKAERVCPILGGHGILLDWDASRGGKGWMGDLSVTLLGGRKMVPQAGVYEIEEMDFIAVVTPMTRRQIKASYGVDVPKGDEVEADPEVRAMGAVADTTGEILTVVTVFHRDDEGKIGRIRWVDGTEILLEDIDDYQARRVKRCTKCGAVSRGAGKTPCEYCELEPAIEHLVRNIIDVATLYDMEWQGQKVAALAAGGYHVNVVFDDGVTQDRQTNINEGVMLVGAGLLSKFTFMTDKKYGQGLTPEQAEEELQRIRQEGTGNSVDVTRLFGGTE